MICNPKDIVVIPFPFAEKHGVKRRPALIVSVWSFNRGGHSVMAMITSASHNIWPSDVAVTDLEAAGLSKPSKIRFKLFTLDNRVIIRKLGKLGGVDAEAFNAELRSVLARRA